MLKSFGMAQALWNLQSTMPTYQLSVRCVLGAFQIVRPQTTEQGVVEADLAHLFMVT